jgi:heptosyltransferase-2
VAIGIRARVPEDVTASSSSVPGSPGLAALRGRSDPAGFIIRLPNWLGDTVMAIPAVRSLRAAFPDERLSLAGPWATLLAGQGLADVLVAYPRSWSGRLRTADHVRDLRAGVAVLLPNSLEAALAARYWRAQRRVGFAIDGRSWLLTDRVPVPEPRGHQIDEYLALVQALGVPPLTREPRLAPPAVEAAERRAARALLAEAGLGDRAPRPIIGVHLGAEFGPAKRWPVERVVEFCREVTAASASAVLLGAPRDLPLAERVVAVTGTPSLVGRDSPQTLTAVLAEIAALVSGDTGVAHLAAALGTPVVTLFGPTDPALSGPRGLAATVRHPVPCAPCFYRACPIEHPCMRGIAARDVHERVRALLSSSA